jgi:hypothetical protein
MLEFGLSRFLKFAAKGIVRFEIGIAFSKMNGAVRIDPKLARKPGC